MTEGGSADRVRSILQYTDGWSSGETIDTSFANWAKANAKTFMSVLYLDKYSGDNSSKQKMIDIGHPNVLDIYGDKKLKKILKMLSSILRQKQLSLKEPLNKKEQSLLVLKQI